MDARVEPILDCARRVRRKRIEEGELRSRCVFLNAVGCPYATVTVGAVADPPNFIPASRRREFLFR
jgi:hypothetical protein